MICRVFFDPDNDHDPIDENVEAIMAEWAPVELQFNWDALGYYFYAEEDAEEGAEEGAEEDADDGGSGAY